MVLSQPMKRGLTLARRFNGIEREQLYFLLKKEFPERNPNLDINRLIRMKLIAEKDDIIFIPETDTIPHITEAVRIMQIFWSKDMLEFSRRKYPIKLRFIKQMQGKPHYFYVCVSDDISGLRFFKDNATVIIITEDKNLVCPFISDYLLAVKENGRYNFYKPKKEEHKK